MKKINAFAGLLIIAIFAFSCMHAKEWVPFEDSSCKMIFPKKPVNETQTVPSVIGDLKMNMWQYEVPALSGDENLMYGLIESSYPDSLINSDKTDLLPKFFRGSIDGAVGNVHGSLLSEKTIEINGYPGREAKIDVKDKAAIITMRAYLVKNNMYILQVISGEKKADNPSIAKFMNSFALKH